MIKVFIDGSHGTTGLRLKSRLEKRDDIKLIGPGEEKRKDKEARREAINESDITFLCLPDDASRESVSLLENNSTVIFDTSTAFRTDPSWAYGFPELSEKHLKKIKSSKKIAVPGCHASGFISIVYPLVEAGIMPKDYPCVCHSLTGYSGGGKKMISQYENGKTEDLFSPRQYGLNQNHKHLKEMKYVTGLDNEPIFTPIVDDYYSGMATSVPVFSSLCSGATKKQIHSCLAEKYKDSGIITVLPVDGGDDNINIIASNILSGKDSMEILVSGNDDRIFITSIFDNLGKGASGAAVECMNISVGLDEKYSLVL